MIRKTQAILLSKRQYGDKSLIINLLTENDGLLSCFVRNAFSKSMRLDRIQPLSTLEVVYTTQENRDLAQSREISLKNARKNVFNDILRTTVAFYMAELLNRVIRQELQPDRHLYHMLDVYTERLGANAWDAELPLQFTLEVIQAMGFTPSVNGEPVFINHVEGEISDQAFGLHYSSDETVPLLAFYLENGHFPHRLTKQERNRMFQLLTTYLDHQLGEPLQLKSPAVLQELLND